MCAEVKSLNEECGVFGVWGDPHANVLTHLAYTPCNIVAKKGPGSSA